MAQKHTHMSSSICQMTRIGINTLATIMTSVISALLCAIPGSDQKFGKNDTNDKKKHEAWGVHQLATAF